jgi:hypothetical protein
MFIYFRIIYRINYSKFTAAINLKIVQIGTGSIIAERPDEIANALLFRRKIIFNVYTLKLKNMIYL